MAVDRAPAFERVPGESQDVRKNGAGNLRDLRYTRIFRRKRRSLHRWIHREAACILSHFHSSGRSISYRSAKRQVSNETLLTHQPSCRKVVAVLLQTNATH